MILQSSGNPKRNTHRDVNTLGGNTLGLLREVRNFVLFKIYGCVIQRSLNENINFCFILLSQKLSDDDDDDDAYSLLYHGRFWHFTPFFLKKKIGNMPLFPNYIGACLCFDTQLP